MIVFLGNSGKLPETAGWAEATFYFVALVLCGALFLVPMIWSTIWLGLMITLKFNYDINWGHGLLVCYGICLAGLALCVVAAIAKVVILEIKNRKK